MGRSRTYDWEDPAVSATAVGQYSGLDFLREVQAGRLPAAPIAATLGMTFEEVEHGRVVFALVPGEEHYNPIGSVHGGVYATLLDSAAGCAVQSVLPEGMGYTSLDLNVKFLRPVTVDTGKVRAVGTVLNSGRRTALAQAELFDSGNRLLAHTTSSCLLFPV
ncbi:PaaI family thioesterase [Streptomyces mirabilis]|uniref:PaaI family thioesterase n=1 Tax=Streptomyces TaxID=1883 RepID=UPI00116247F3|nr:MULTISPECIES: PaaI family thioesterase [Streptomyces]MCX4616143.1 PaaI family thioesterase [Streptomyces mirabilis]MCX5347082.1 PaaI family thioesterase [Streptomyces mirabilis]QDO06633.1 PaaI family thioesterase [Streptomyces sp. S1D4-23]